LDGFVVPDDTGRVPSKALLRNAEISMASCSEPAWSGPK
jgi:hypothetical protein